MEPCYNFCMAVGREGYPRSAVFGGAAGGSPSREGLRAFHEEWEAADKDWEKMNPERAAELDAMWLAASFGRLLAENKWQLITGGYDMGTMGMVNRAAVIYGKRHGSEVLPIGAPLNKDYFPRDPLVEAEIEHARDLPERLQRLTDAEAFIILRGAHGTLNELTTVIEQEDLRSEAMREGELEFRERPIIIADPSGKMSALLEYIFSEYVPRFYQDQGPNVIDRIYLLDNECFEETREHPLSATVKLSEKGKEQVLSILGLYSGTSEVDAVDIHVPSLRGYLRSRERDS